MTRANQVQKMWIKHWGRLNQGQANEFLTDERVTKICSFRLEWIEDSIEMFEDLDDILIELHKLHQSEVNRLESEAIYRRRAQEINDESNKRAAESNARKQKKARKARELKKAEERRTKQERLEPFHNPSVSSFTHAKEEEAHAERLAAEKQARAERQESFAQQGRLGSKSTTYRKNTTDIACTGCGQPIRPNGFCGCS